MPSKSVPLNIRFRVDPSNVRTSTASPLTVEKPYLQVLMDWQMTGQEKPDKKVAKERIAVCFNLGKEKLAFNDLDIPQPPDLRACTNLRQITLDWQQTNLWAGQLQLPDDCKIAVGGMELNRFGKTEPIFPFNVPVDPVAIRARIAAINTQVKTGINPADLQRDRKPKTLIASSSALPSASLVTVVTEARVPKTPQEQAYAETLDSWVSADPRLLDISEAHNRMWNGFVNGATVLELSDLSELKPLPNLRAWTGLKEVRLDWEQASAWRIDPAAPYLRLPAKCKVILPESLIGGVGGMESLKYRPKPAVTAAKAQVLMQRMPSDNLPNAQRENKRMIVQRLAERAEEAGKSSLDMNAQIDLLLAGAAEYATNYLASKEAGTISQMDFLVLAAETVLESADRSRLPEICQRLLDDLPRLTPHFPLFDLKYDRATIRNWASGKNLPVIDSQAKAERAMEDEVRAGNSNLDWNRNALKTAVLEKNTYLLASMRERTSKKLTQNEAHQVVKLYSMTGKQAEPDVLRGFNMIMRLDQPSADTGLSPKEVLLTTCSYVESVGDTALWKNLQAATATRLAQIATKEMSTQTKINQIINIPYGIDFSLNVRVSADQMVEEIEKMALLVNADFEERYGDFVDKVKSKESRAPLSVNHDLYESITHCKREMLIYHAQVKLVIERGLDEALVRSAVDRVFPPSMMQRHGPEFERES